MSGEISLACSWRVTPLDVASIKVKAKQTELDHREEVLALLLEKYSIQDGAWQALTEPAEDALGRRSVPEAKHMQSLRGQLAIKVGSTEHHTHCLRPILTHIGIAQCRCWQ